MQRRSPYMPSAGEGTPRQRDWSRPPEASGSGYSAVPSSPAIDFGRRKSLVKVDLGEAGRRGSILQLPNVKLPKGKSIPGSCKLLLRLLFVVAGAAGLWLVLSAILLPTPPAPHYTCPNPLLPRPAFPSFPQHLSKPQRLPSLAPDLFSLSLSYSTIRCNAFRLIIARRDRGVCRRAPGTVRAVMQVDVKESPKEGMSWDEKRAREKLASEADELDVEVKRRLGPDGFHVQVDGAERVAREVPNAFNADNCEYTFDFTLVNAGPVWINITHLFEDYSAFNEVDAVAGSRPKPQLLMRPLLEHPVELHLCPASSCAPYAVPPLARSASLPKVYGVPTAPLPACPTSKRNDSLELQGGYLPSPHQDLLYPPLPLPLSTEHTRPTAGLQTFVRPHCSALQFSHDGLRFRDHASCLRPASGAGGGVRHRALIIGDSHGRAVFDVSVWRLIQGEQGVALSSPKALSKKEEKGGLGLEFAWDPYLTSGFSCEYLQQFDSITVSAGTHTAAWNCPTTASHLAHLRSILHTWPRLLRQCHESPPSTSSLASPSASFIAGRLPTLILLTIPSFHPQLHNHDCRTGARIAWWNEKAKEMASVEGWQVVDYEGYSRGMAVDTATVGDGVHYLKTDAMDPLVDDWISRLGVCGDEDRPK